MSKILVEVRIPAIERRYDVLIPYESRIFEVTALLKSLFADEADGNFLPTSDTLLCDAETGAILDPNLAPQVHGLRNGSRLLLI